MPHAILLGKPTLWQKLTGNRPSYKTVTVWKLVDYDAEPAAPSPIAGESPHAALTPMPPETDATGSMS